MRSCIYRGHVRHARRGPVRHAFRFRLFMLYLDLEELPRLFAGRWLWSSTRPALARFRREDHLGDPTVPLSESVRDLVEARTGRRPQGAVRLLTHLRYLGHGFNPVSFYYCFDREERLEAVVAEVTNIPWGERHCYVVTGQSCAKELHVSPFMDMDSVYDWTLPPPGPELRLRIESRAPGEAPFFSAELSLRRVEICTRTLTAALLRFPLMTLQVVAAIHWQALRLWWKRAPFYPHPAQAACAAGTSKP